MRDFPTSSFNEEMEKSAQDGTEWKFGAIQTDLALIPYADRVLWLPAGVNQFNRLMDTNGCASRSPINIAEAKSTYFYHNGMHKAIKKWFKDNGFVFFELVSEEFKKRYGNTYPLTDGKLEVIRYNDAFIEILSGTTRQGNSLKAPVDAIYKYGLIPADKLPLEENMTWEQYMDKSRITEEMMTLGKEFKKRIGINYEQTSDHVSALTEDYYDTGLHAWGELKDGVYQRVAQPFNHAVALANNEIDCLDNYQPYIKRLAKDYNFFLWGYSLSITLQNPFPEETVSVFNLLFKNGLLSFFPDFLKRLFQNTENVLTEVVDGEVPRYPDDMSEPPKPKPEPVTMVAGVNTRGRPHGWRGDQIEVRKELYKMAVEVGQEKGLHKYESKLLPKTHKLIDDYLATIEGESGFTQYCVNDRNKNGSADYGIAQFNSSTYCKEYNMTPQECVDNPRKCLEIMAINFKTPRRHNWFAFRAVQKNPDGTITYTYPAKERLEKNTLKIYA